MRTLSMLVCLSGCATQNSAALEKMLDEQQIANEDLRKKILYELESLRSDIAGVKEKQEELLAKMEKMEGRNERPTPPTPSRRRGPDPDEVYAFPIGESAIRGPREAWVTIVQISEFQCPFCNRVQPTLDQVRDKYGNDVRIVFKHNPLSFHARAMPAAIAVECARKQNIFWPLHDVLFKNQRQLEDDQLAQYARKAGQLNMKIWKRCVDNEEPKEMILEDQRTAIKLGARGTPAFFVNGRFLSGAQPFPAFEKLIDEELKKAKASGIPKARYYQEAVIKKGRDEV